MQTDVENVAYAIKQMIALGRQLAENDMHCTAPVQQEDGAWRIIATFENNCHVDGEEESIKVEILVRAFA